MRPASPGSPRGPGARPRSGRASSRLARTLALGAGLFLALLALSADADAEPGLEQRVRHETEHFTFVYRSRFWGSIRDTVQSAERSRESVVELLGAAPPPGRVEVRFARNVDELRELSPRRPPDYADAVAFWPENLLVVSLTSSHHRPVGIETVFRHELAHLALRWSVGEASVPRWFNEGLAVYLSDELSLDRLRVLWPAAASGQVIPLERLDRSFPRREFQVNLAYAQSADLVRYLVHHDGRWRLEMLLGKVRDGVPFDRAIAETWNRGLQEIEREWRADLARRFSVVPAMTAGVTLWVVVGLLAVLAFVKRRREVRRRIAAMADEAVLPDAES